VNHLFAADTDFKLDFTGRTLQLLYGRGLISSTVHSNVLDKCDDPAKGFPTGFSISKGLPSCVGLSKELFCGLEASEYFSQFIQWLLAAEAGDHSQLIPNCVGNAEPISGSASIMAELDAMNFSGDPFGPAGSLPPGYQSQLLLQLNGQIWQILFSQLEEQSADFLAQYRLTVESTFLIGARGTTPVWTNSNETDPLGRTIVSAHGLLDVFD